MGENLGILPVILHEVVRQTKVLQQGQGENVRVLKCGKRRQDVDEMR